MKETGRKGLVLLLVTLMVGGTTASSFGTFTSKTDVETSGGSGTYDLTVFNRGKQDLNITFQPVHEKDVSVAIDSQQVGLKYGSDSSASFHLEASPPTENPGQDGSWFYLGDGKYIRTYRFNIRADLLDGSYGSFDLDIRAKSDSGQGNNASKVVQVRTYSYSLRGENIDKAPQSQQGGSPNVGFDNFGGGDSNGGFSGIPGVGLQGGSGTSSNENSSDEPQVVVDNGSSGQHESTENVTGSFNQSDSSSDESGSGNSFTGGFFQSQNINGVTAILVIGVLASGAYLYKVI